MKGPHFCKTCGQTTKYRLLPDRDAWVCLWDNTVTNGIEEHEALKLGEWQR